MKSKKFTRVLCLLLPAFLLSGCTVSDAKKIAKKGIKNAEKTIESVKSSDSSSNDSSEEDTALPYQYEFQDMDREGLKTFFKTDTTIEKTVLFDDDGVVITADSLLINGEDVMLNFTFENKTNHDLYFSSSGLDGNQASINGFAIDGLTIDEMVSKRDKEEFTYPMEIYPLLRDGITEIHNITIPMRLQLTNEDGGDVIAETGPLTIITSAGDVSTDTDPYQAMYPDSDILSAFNLTTDAVVTDTLFDEQSVRINHAALVTEKDGSEEVLLEYENYGNDSVEIFISDPEIDDVVLPGIGTAGSVNIGPGQKYVQTIDFDRFVPGELLEKFGLSKINKFAIQLRFEEILTGNIITEPEIFAVNFDDANAPETPTLSFGTEQKASYVAEVFSGGFADSEYNDTDAQYVIAITNSSDNDMTYGMVEDTFSANDVSYGMNGPYTEPIVLRSGQTGLFSFNMAKSDFTDLFKVNSYDEIKTVDFTLEAYPASKIVSEGGYYKYESDDSEPLTYDIHIDMD